MPRYHNKVSRRRLLTGGSSPAMLDETVDKKKEVWLPEVLQADPLLGTAAAAQALNITPVHLRRLCRAGRAPPPLKVGYRKLAWRLSTITKFLSDREHVAQREGGYEPPLEEHLRGTVLSAIPCSTAKRRRRS